VRGTGTEIRDYDLQEIADVICFLMRILHFFSELFGPDLGSKIVPAISSIVQLAVVREILSLRHELTGIYRCLAVALPLMISLSQCLSRRLVS
jgi:hypothetical protein